MKLSLTNPEDARSISQQRETHLKLKTCVRLLGVLAIYYTKLANMYIYREKNTRLFRQKLKCHTLFVPWSIHHDRANRLAASFVQSVSVRYPANPKLTL